MQIMKLYREKSSADIRQIIVIRYSGRQRRRE